MVHQERLQPNGRPAHPDRHQRLGIEGLQVKGRTSGEWRINPVNLLVIEGSCYLVPSGGHDRQ
jgi:hypothetical protein